MYPLDTDQCTWLKIHLGKVGDWVLELASVLVTVSGKDHLGNLLHKQKCILHMYQLDTDQYTLLKFPLGKEVEWVLELASVLVTVWGKAHLGNLLHKQKCILRMNPMGTVQHIWPEFLLGRLVDSELELELVSECHHIPGRIC